MTQQAVAEAISALPESPRPGWTPEQETQIRAMEGLIRKVRYLTRTNLGWWRKQREWRARQRLVDLAMAGEPEMFNEAELRHWKSHMTVEVLLEFAASAMKRADTEWRSAAWRRCTPRRTRT
ncbi:hypothetical protein [Streptomyces sp. CB02959]|uniref:hypothetical protein n=1 Tax=Streptomyces sp. CB02959 TaxID=2020330 RepID=UPI0011AFC7F1|nr:hypothetical protein [Streptomyces sp. CB02959]